MKSLDLFFNYWPPTFAMCIIVVIISVIAAATRFVQRRIQLTIAAKLEKSVANVSILRRRNLWCDQCRRQVISTETLVESAGRWVIVEACLGSLGLTHSRDVDTTFLCPDCGTKIEKQIPARAMN